MKLMRVWLSRERSGLYMMTSLKPQKALIGLSDVEDFYVPEGDAFGIRHWCAEGVRIFFGVDIAIGEQVHIEFILPGIRRLT